MMDDPINRWSQIVRSPGTVLLSGHHASQVPAQGEEQQSANRRDSLRLMVHPVSMPRPVFLIDIESRQVQAMLEGFLRSGVAVGKYLSWSTSGFGVRRRDTVRIRPKA